MSELILSHPVHTLEKRLLLPAGTTLSSETLKKLAASGRGSSHREYPLLRHGSIGEDLEGFLHAPAYRNIFSSQEQIADLLEFMEGVQIVGPVLDSLDYFKEQDNYTYRHILMVFVVTILLAGDVVPDQKERVREATTGPAHDFGKICIPLSILKKSTPLTKAERGILEHHAGAGFVLLTYYLQDSRNLAAIVARDHHERRNGSGYPGAINLVDRRVEVVVVSDIYDALISPRPYRPASYDNRTALEEITAMAGRNEIGWSVVKALVAQNRRGKPNHQECFVSLDRRGKPPQGNVYGQIADEKGGPPGRKRRLSGLEK